MKTAPYALITPARNEERYIEKTIKSVIAQTSLPMKWVIVSDASEDRTDEIVSSYAQKYAWMEFLRKPAQDIDYFSSLITTFKTGYNHIRHLPYHFIGKLDADIYVNPDYYEAIIKKFRENPRLGVAGGEVIDYYHGEEIHYHPDKNSVAGAIHLFRRECYEAIGGFVEMQEGGYDAVAEVMARMHGWETRTFFDILVYHLKPLNLSSGSHCKRKWQVGRRDYFLGNHPVFEVAKCCFRSFEKPYVIGSFIRLTAYFSLWLKKAERTVPGDVIRFLRKEQIGRLFPCLKKEGNPQGKNYLGRNESIPDERH